MKTPIAERLSDLVTLYEGDCMDVLPTLAGVDAVISDPPYGMNWNTDSTRFVGGKGGHIKCSPRIIGDQAPFDPAPWVSFRKVVLWGANHFSMCLPVGTTLVWLKKSDSKLGVMLSDAEIAWMKSGHGVYVMRQIWDGCAREGGENGVHLHPTQKPVALIRWCIHKANIDAGDIILDPFAGSGTTGVAATLEGRKCILIERDPAYCEVIRKRIAEANGVGRGSLFTDVQPDMFTDDEGGGECP